MSHEEAVEATLQVWSTRDQKSVQKAQVEALLAVNDTLKLIVVELQKAGARQQAALDAINYVRDVPIGENVE